MAILTSIRDCSMSIVDQLTIESLSAGLLSPSHLHCTQWCEVDGWCDGERQSRTRMRKTYGRFSMHLCPREIRKVAEERIGKSFTQSFSEKKTLFLTFVISYEIIKVKMREGLRILTWSSSCWMWVSLSEETSHLQGQTRKDCIRAVSTLEWFDSAARVCYILTI